MITVTPVVPEEITVHLGPPSSSARNVTVPFADYVKNVAASEIYPTWDESALRANILAIVSFALNRVYLEYYRSRGYSFDITSSTAYDQSFVEGRNTFSQTDRLVDDLFNSYLRRQGYVEPLAAKFCNGTTTTCDGLSQWGSQALAEEGYNSVEILRSYYGPDIEIVPDAPIGSTGPSYPGTPLRQGDSGPEVVVLQTMLNRVSQNYPAIPKVNPIDGSFGPQTLDAVTRFQGIFNLAQDGIVGKGTWYQLVRLYVAVLKLAELRSEGQTFYGVNWEYPDAIEEGNSGPKVQHLQYMLAVVSEFNPEIPSVEVDGKFGPETKQAVLAFQRWAGLPQTGAAGAVTWDTLYNSFAGIEREIFNDLSLFPFRPQGTQDMSVRGIQQRLQQLAGLRGGTAPEVNGVMGRQTQQAISQFQRQQGLPVTGRADAQLYAQLGRAIDAHHFANTTHMTQFPGFPLRMGTQEAFRV